MTTNILTINEFSNLNKIKKKYNIYRAINIQARDSFNVVEFMNRDGVFRGFGKNTKKAFKSAKKVLKTHYKLCA